MKNILRKAETQYPWILSRNSAKGEKEGSPRFRSWLSWVLCPVGASSLQGTVGVLRNLSSLRLH